MKNRKYFLFIGAYIFSTILSSAVLAGSAGTLLCKNQGTPVYKTINDFIKCNNHYFEDPKFRDTKTGFPYDNIPYGYLFSSSTSIPKNTQPSLIGFYVQYLVDKGSIKKLQILVNGLLQVQSDPTISVRGLLPWISFDMNNNAYRSNPTIAFGDNITLSMKVAMIIGRYQGVDPTNSAINKLVADAKTFLENQREGYQELYAEEKGLLYATMDNTYYIDRLFNEFRAGVAFAVAYFGVNEKAWKNIVDEPPTGTYVAENGTSIKVPKSWDGGGFQFSWSLLSLPEHKLNYEMGASLYNSLYTFLDYSNSKKAVGILSASGSPSGAYLGDIGAPPLRENTIPPTLITVFSIYALSPYMHMLYGENRKTLLKWINAYAAVQRMKGDYGLYDSYDSNTYAITRMYYGVDNGSMVLLNSKGPQYLMTFLEANGCSEKLKELYASISLGVKKITLPLPLPVFNPEGGF